MTVDHVLKFRPSDQGFEAKVVCKILEEKRDGKCLEMPYKTTCWVEELWNDIGTDMLEKSDEDIPWVICPIKVRMEGSGDDAEGWVVPMSPQEVFSDDSAV